ncbi:CPBP family intramembrane glutamic endopeptidase [Streptosporangium carneum]|uniref:CPBP family intramembrane glutamic endopeptidase n=1 Tax=Streptosporangium carneum TaxID=47481 RepID=UPI0022F2FC1D|nr:type II CAAX endopeptidase family protein [Streptosporangium carneum]
MAVRGETDESTAVTVGARAALAGAVAVLAAANVLNNRVAPRMAPLTSTLTVGALLALARRHGVSWSEMGFRERSRGLLIGGLLASAVAGVYSVGIAVPATRRFFRDERALSLSRARAIEEALLQVPFGTVLLEEVGFRGVVHALVARTHGTATATAVSSALFGLWHVLPAIDMMAANPALSRLASGEAPQDGEAGADRAPDPRGGPSAGEVARVVAGSVAATAVAGVFFCELRRRGGLAAPSLFHFATNSLGYLFARLAPPDSTPAPESRPRRDDREP